VTRPLFRALRRFRHAHQGAAAVELALVIPVLAGIAAGVMQYGGMILAYQAMHNGIASGAIYVMRGGADTTAIHDLALGAWSNKPGDAAITVAQSCTCAGVTAACTSLCADQSYPQAFTTISAAGTYAGPFATQSMAATQVIRTQ
jgi:Flp pilus assembly protein TadG